MSYIYAYPRASNTATITLIVDRGEDEAGVLIGTRKAGTSAYPGYECIPGGFVDVKVEEGDYVVEGSDCFYPLSIMEDADFRAKAGETVEQAAVREIQEETGLVISEDRLKLYHVSSKPNTDPRAHVVNTCFYVVLTEEEANSAKAGDDLSKLRIAKYSRVNPEIKTLAFDHAKLLSLALKAYWREKLVARALDFLERFGDNNG